MYNEELKNDYIKESLNRNSTIENDAIVIFKRVEDYENELDKDASTFTIKEITTMYKSFFTSSLESLMQLTSQLKLYTNYCLSRNLVPDKQNHYMEIDLDILDTCLNKVRLDAQVITREQLYGLMDDMLNDSDKFLTLALFEGICGRAMCELADLKLSDFNGNHVTLCTGRELDVSDKLLELANKSSKQYTYYAYTINIDFSEKEFDPTDEHIIKRQKNSAGEGNESSKRRRLLNRLVRLQDSLGTPALASKALNESGRMEMINKYKKEFGLETIQALKNSDIEYRYGVIASTKRYLMKYESYIN